MARSNLLTGEHAKAPYRAGETHVVKEHVSTNLHGAGERLLLAV
jgi:hypothetical protein